MIVFLLDLAMISVVFLLAYALHVSQWVLTDLRPDGERGICGFADPAVWWKGVRGWDNFVLVDSCLLQVSLRHWGCAATFRPCWCCSWSISFHPRRCTGGGNWQPPEGCCWR